MSATAQQHRTLRSPEAIQTILSWYSGLHSEHKNAERAQLRRCTSAHEVFWHREYYTLVQKLEEQQVYLRTSHAQTDEQYALAAIVALAPHMKTNRPDASIGRQLALGVGQKNGLSDLRFRRLLSAQTAADALPAFRRAIHILDGSVNAKSVIETLVRWKPDATYLEPSWNPRLRIAENFYSATPKR